jgi:hypothetical protein
MTNWNCDGSGPHDGGEVRVYPLGAGGNLILCRNCFRHENQYRIDRQIAYMEGTKYFADDLRRAQENWPLVDWIMAKVYGADQ